MTFSAFTVVEANAQTLFAHWHGGEATSRGSFRSAEARRGKEAAINPIPSMPKLAPVLKTAAKRFHQSSFCELTEVNRKGVESH